MRKMYIQITRIFKESFSQPLKQSVVWLRLGFAPLVLFAISILFTLSFYLLLGQTTGLDAPTIWYIITFILNAILSVIWGSSLYVNGYRYGILNEGGDKWWHLSLNMRLLRMISYSLLMSLPIGGPGFLFSYLYFFEVEANSWVTMAGGGLIILGAYISIRLSLALPMVAIDQKSPLRTSWRMMKGNVFRFFCLILLLMGVGIIFPVIIILAFSRILEDIIPFQIIILLWQIIPFLIISMLVYGIGLVGLVYYYFSIFMIVTAAFSSTPLYILAIMNIILLPSILLLTWVVSTKALSLFYLSLIEEKT